MGVSFSCPFAESIDFETGFESAIVKSIFGEDEVKSFGRDGKMIVKGSISFERRENEPIVSTIMAPLPEKHITLAGDSKHEAALKLQKVYKSFRTRRKLADCAVLVEQSWWKLLDFAELKRSSVSFFELEKHETAISKWSRAKNRAAKVGKGLSKNGKARKLALQHWLEAIDPRHRYGHNLHFYYVKWLNCQSREPFFYWLDIGEGKEVNLVEKCPRSKLQLQCIKYLGPMERKRYEVVIEDGKLAFLQTGELLDTTGGSKDDKWIFVLSTSKTFYVGKKKKGTFQHSSFLAGGATMCAGRLVVENGIVKAIWPHSGHYQPTKENFKDFISFLDENEVDLSDVKMSPMDDEEGSLYNRRSSIGVRTNLSDEDLTLNKTSPDTLKEISGINELTSEQPKSTLFHSFGRKLTVLDIPNRRELFDGSETENPAVESPTGDHETAEEAFVSDPEDMVSNQNLFDDEEEVNETSIHMIGIDSRKGLNSYHLHKQLSRTWSNGTGPRIGCVGECPSELRIRALEHVNLSPSSIQRSRKQLSSFVR